MKMNEITGLSTDEIKNAIAEKKHFLHKMLVSHAVAPVEDPTQIKKTKKAIARLLTELNKRHLAEAK